MSDKPTKLEDQMDQKDVYNQIMIDAQKKQITVLNKKINEQKLEIEELKLKLKNSEVSPRSYKDSKKDKITPEETICKQEIDKLLEISNDRELSLEESKKFDTFVKILNSKKTVKEEAEKVDNLSDADLLQFLQTQSK